MLLNEAINNFDKNFLEAYYLNNNLDSLSPRGKILFFIDFYTKNTLARGKNYMATFLSFELKHRIDYKSTGHRKAYILLDEFIKEYAEVCNISNSDKLLSKIFRILRGITYDWIISSEEINFDQEISEAINTILPQDES